MKTNLYDVGGNLVGEVELPKVFEEPVREDLVLRVVLAIQSRKRQPYGTDPMAGKRTSAHYHGRRRERFSMMNREMARLPRIHGRGVPPFLMWEARFVPQARGGRRAHPPKVEKIWEQKVNKKERKKAIRAAIAATAKKELVEKRGHRVEKVEKLPIVVKDELQRIERTSELKKLLENLNLKEELERISKRKVRAGKGKMRGRRYKVKKGPLIVVAKDEGISKAARNLLGVDLCLVKDLNAELLAPGGKCGRLAIFSESALKFLERVGF